MPVSTPVSDAQWQHKITQLRNNVFFVLGRSGAPEKFPFQSS
jgi:hypothetical protein